MPSVPEETPVRSRTDDTVRQNINKMLNTTVLSSEDYAIMCNLPQRGGSDSLRGRPGYEYGVDGPEDPAEPFVPLYWDSYGIPDGVPLFNDNDYGVQQPPARVPVPRPREQQPQPVDSPVVDPTGGCRRLRGV